VSPQKRRRFFGALSQQIPSTSYLHMANPAAPFASLPSDAGCALEADVPVLRICPAINPVSFGTVSYAYPVIVPVMSPKLHFIEIRTHPSCI
jgi:hypothetical protein